MKRLNRSHLLPFCLVAALWIGVSDAKAQVSSGWDGMYVSGALSSSSYKHTIDSLHTYNAGYFPNSQNPSAINTDLSVQLGKNWTFDRVLVGLEIDYDPSKSTKTVCRGASEITRCITAWEGYLNISDSIDLQGSGKIRLGYILDKFMIYTAVGFARLKHSSSLDVVCPSGCGLSDSDSYTAVTTVSENKTRPVFGFGFEYKVSERWNVGADYQYLQSGNLSQTQQKTATYGTQQISSTSSVNVSRAQLRLIYRF